MPGDSVVVARLFEQGGGQPLVEFPRVLAGLIGVFVLRVTTKEVDQGIPGGFSGLRVVAVGAGQPVEAFGAKERRVCRDRVAVESALDAFADGMRLLVILVGLEDEGYLDQRLRGEGGCGGVCDNGLEQWNRAFRGGKTAETGDAAMPRARRVFREFELPIQRLIVWEKTGIVLDEILILVEGAFGFSASLEHGGQGSLCLNCFRRIGPGMDQRVVRTGGAAQGAALFQVLGESQLFGRGGLGGTAEPAWLALDPLPHRFRLPGRGLVFRARSRRRCYGNGGRQQKRANSETETTHEAESMRGGCTGQAESLDSRKGSGTMPRMDHGGGCAAAGERAAGENAVKKVLIPTKLDKVAADLLRANGHYAVVQDDAGDVAALAAQHPDAYALIVRSEPVTAAIIDQLPQMKVVIRAGAGYNTIDTKHARKRGIDVMNTPGANANAVAEEVIALMLADARHLIKADASCRAGEWEKKAFMGREIAGKTVGIVGLGNIGRLVARRLSGFDVTLLGYDPMIARERAAEFGVTLTDLETLFERSDYVTLHIPETAETKKLVNETLLRKMKKGATLINCARAGVLDEAALRRVKPEKGLRFLNDVYPKDEPGPKSVADIADIMVPHLGASTKEANANAARRAAEQLIEYDEKGVTSYIVNRDIPEGLDEVYCTLAHTLAKVARAEVGREATLKMIETGFYGPLKSFGDWLIVPMVAALWEEFDRAMDAKAAVAFLKERGIEYVRRPTEDRKGFENSITVDLTASMDTAHLRKASVRGTVVENTVMLSRINDFDKLYFEPQGHTVVFQYKDRPGVVGRIGNSLAEAGVNIEDIRHSHNLATDESLAIMKVNRSVSDTLVQKIAQEIGALMAFRLDV